MQVTLNIDSSNLGDTVIDLFHCLSPEKKETLALEVMTKWLSEPYDVERKAYEEEAKRKALDKVLSSSYSYDKERYGTLEKVSGSDEYKNLMRNYESSREKMIKVITEEAVQTYRKHVVEFIKTDKNLAVVMEATLDAIKKDFPKFTHDALMYWFAQNMATTMQNASFALEQSTNNANLNRQIAQELGIIPR